MMTVSGYAFPTFHITFWYEKLTEKFEKYDFFKADFFMRRTDLNSCAGHLKHVSDVNSNESETPAL